MGNRFASCIRAPLGAIRKWMHVTVNQGESERDVQRSVLTEAGLPCAEIGVLEIALSPLQSDFVGRLA